MADMIRALIGLTFAMTSILLIIIWLYPINAAKKRGPIWILIISIIMAMIATININGAISKKNNEENEIKYIDIETKN